MMILDQYYFCLFEHVERWVLKIFRMFQYSSFLNNILNNNLIKLMTNRKLKSIAESFECIEVAFLMQNCFTNIDNNNEEDHTYVSETNIWFVMDKYIFVIQ